MTGALIIDKPSGMTSHDVVGRVRRAARTRRVGHAGTLDPFATGVLVVCIERATRLMQFLVGLNKEYLATIRLGFATDSQDLTGQQITPIRSSDQLKDEEVYGVLAGFLGPQLQMPPMFSAKKVAGERLYRAARQGRVIEREPVAIEVQALDLLRFGAAKEDGTRELEVRVRCSSGTYVRTLANDIGERLGTGAHLSALRRTAVGQFRIEDGLSLEEVDRRSQEGSLADLLISPAVVLSHLPMLQIGDTDVQRIASGRELEVMPDSIPLVGTLPMVVRICDRSGRLAAVGEVDREAGVVRPRVVLISPEGERI